MTDRPQERFAARAVTAVAERTKSRRVTVEECFGIGGTLTERIRISGNAIRLIKI